MRELKFKSAPALLLTLGLSTLALAGSNESHESRQRQSVEFINPGCVTSHAELLPLLSRGEHFPKFLLKDINAALLKQSKTSVLKSVECYADVEIETVSIPDEDSPQNLLSELTFAFPLVLNVTNGANKYTITAEQKYNATNLQVPQARKLTYTFKVLGQTVNDKADLTY